MSAEEVDVVLSRLGGYGRYQLLMYTGLGLVYGGQAWHTFVLIFLAWPPEHYCTPWFTNRTLGQSTRLEKNDSGQVTWSQCAMYQDASSVGASPGNTTVSCQLGWTYVWDREGETSIVSDWDLVCEKDYLSQLPMIAFMVGCACGAPVLTVFADRWGRKSVLVSSVLVQFVVGLGTAFVQSLWGFAVLQFFQGAVGTTGALCAFLLVVETFDKETRHLPAYSIYFFWSGEMMLTSLIAYCLPQWRQLQLAGTLLQALRLTYVCFLPESLSWLLITGKITRAREIISRILRVNKLPPLDNLEETMNRFQSGLAASCESELRDNEKSTRKSIEPFPLAPDTVLDLFKRPRMRRYSVFLFFICLVSSLAYFGISFSMPLLSGDKYINSMLSGAVEIPSHVVCILFNQRRSRRWSICVYMVMCAVAILCQMLLPDTTASGVDLIVVKTAFVMVGKFSITSAYSIIHLYVTEVFPTSVRNHAVGISSSFESIGSIIAPLVVYSTKTTTQLPMTLFSVMTVMGAVLVLFLPETHNAPLPQTIEDVEHWDRNSHSDPFSPKTPLLNGSVPTASEEEGSM